MKINIPKEWFEEKIKLEEGEIGAGNPNFYKKNIKQKFDYDESAFITGLGAGFIVGFVFTLILVGVIKFLL